MKNALTVYMVNFQKKKIVVTSISKGNQIWFETGDVKEIVNKFSIDLLNKNSIRIYSCYTSKAAVFVERFNRTNRDLLEEPVFERDNANWVDEIYSITERYKFTKQTSTRLTTIHACLKKTKRYVLTTFLKEEIRLTKSF